MQAIILAAGRGRRMEPLSSTCHKALLEIGGVTILGRAVDSLVAAGVEPVTVVTGYRSDDIRDFLSDRYPGLDVNYIHNDRYDETNNIVSLALALNSIEYEEDVILIECDLLFEPHLITDLIGHGDRNVALVDHYRTGMDGTVVALSDGYVTQVFPTNAQGSDFSYANKFKTLNVYRFDRDFCRTTLRPILTTYADHVDANCYYELVLGMLANIPAHRISALLVQESDWVEVDDPNDLMTARFAFETRGRAAQLDRSFGGHWAFGILDFSLPRNAYFPPPAMLAALRHGLPDIISGYGSAQEVLDEKVALFVGCRSDRVLLLNGASSIYPLLRQLFEGSSVLRPDVTFGEYARCFPGAATYTDQPGIDLADLERRAGAADLVVLVNPNNPSGTVVPTGWIYDLAARTPETLMLIDESFLPFSEQPSLIRVLESAPLDNVAVLTSLGKGLGVPGLRLGHFYSTGRKWRERVREQLPIWGVNALAEFFLELTIKFRADLDRSIQETVAERARLQEMLLEVPYVRKVYDSAANFLLTELNGDGRTLAATVRAELLAAHKIEVKDVSGKYNDKLPRLRLSVRTREENTLLLEALHAAGVVSSAGVVSGR
jgi:histidinol-phosphate/aromatic aminotransferase/cobyric acid decarboxylase-like protein/choline kinase